MDTNFSLTTTQAAAAAGVTPSTVKRWADRGLVPFTRTVGGHRRFEPFVIERFLRQRTQDGSSSDPLTSAWIDCLLGGRRYEIDGRLLEARSRLGAWWRVADELGGVLHELGKMWESGAVSIAQEHVASDCLTRALSRIGDALPMPVDGPTCVLACAEGDDHTLGLSMTELCLREAGWGSWWLGRRTPVPEIGRILGEKQTAMVAVSASAASTDHTALGEISDVLGAECAKRNVDLVLGGTGAWPDNPRYGTRVSSFGAFHAHLARSEGRRRPSTTGLRTTGCS